jgi:hypothetical protein
MSFQDKTLTCSDCSNPFTFTSEEQEQFHARGYTNEPKRCPDCRQARKTERYGNSGNNYNSSHGERSFGFSTSREMFPLSVLRAENPRRFHSNPARTDRSTAAIATGKKPGDKTR